MKIAFISGRPFGLRGTPGTYKLVERIQKYCDVAVFSEPPNHNSVYRSQSYSVVPIIPPVNDVSIAKVLPKLHRFGPDIIYIFNFPKWHSVIRVLKRVFPAAKFVLDFKTPLLIDGDLRTSIQREGNQEQGKLDAIVTLSPENVSTWIPDCRLAAITYPLGLDLSLFQDISVEQPGELRKFVYVGTIHPKRELHVMVEGFAHFIRNTSDRYTLDIYGAGPATGMLSDLIADYGLQDNIRLRGLVQHEDLLSQLCEFDAGLGWVPTSLYNSSPSLKVIEYMAAGLPILATNTASHRALCELGCSINLCSDNATALADALQELVERGFSKERLQANRRAVVKFDYDTIIEEYLLPLFNCLVNEDSSTKTLVLEESHSRVSGGRASLDQGLDKKLVIVILIDSLAVGKGGAERVAVELADEMARRGHLVYVAYKNDGPAAYQPQHGVVLVPYGCLSGFREDILAIDPDLFFVFYFNRQLISFYELVHGTNIPFGMQECTNPQRLCENNWGRGKMGRIIPAWERELIASAATRIRLTMESYAESFPSYIRPKIHAYANPAFPQPITANPAGVSGKRKEILNVNGFKANKNLIMLVRAFANVAADFPDWDLVVIGKTAEGMDPHRVAIRAVIDENGLHDRIIVSGPTEDVFSYYRRAHFHVISSLSEGCPTVVLEAMSVGLPSVGFADCPGTNELIRDEVNGLLVAQDDRVSALEGALRRMMSLPELRTRLGEQALLDAERFRPKAIYDQWEQLFYEMAEYKQDPSRLWREQMTIDPERSQHARRMLDKLVRIN